MMMQFLLVAILQVLGYIQQPSCEDSPLETGAMIQQMLDHGRFDNHKASGRQYYIQKNDLIPSHFDIQFGSKKILITKADTGTVFKVKRLENTEGGNPVLSLFLVKDNLDAWSTFECQDGVWKMASFKYVVY